MSETAFTLPSFAKINWLLKVLGKRPDGFHELCTVFQTVSLSDLITFSPADDLSLTCSDPRIPLDGTNLINRAAEALRTRFQVGSGAAIHLEKRIPSPGGLGGGSSNAAVALIGLSRLWDLQIVRRELEAMGSELGSDVPFFFTGGTALGSGRGEIVAPLPDIEEKFIIIVTPDAAVSTGESFSRLNAAGLTITDPKRILQICRFDAKFPDLRHSALENDFETSVFAAHPEIRRVKETLLRLGASKALMSGSGASVFAIFDKQETRQTAIKALEIESSWRKFVVAAVSRDEYREQVFGEP
jgi:4-diphosphocytidyl-2-C-methyl-D-erythritol kinase